MTEESIQQGIEQVIRNVNLLRQATAQQANGRFPFKVDSLQNLDEVFPKHYSLRFGICPEDSLGTEFTIGIEKGCEVKKHVFKNPLRRNYICPIEGGIYTLLDKGVASMEYRIQQMSPEIAIFRSTYHHLEKQTNESISAAIRLGVIDPASKEVWKDGSSKIKQPTTEDAYRMKTFLDECEPEIRQMLGIEKHNDQVTYLLPKTAFYSPEVRKKQ